MSGSPFRPVSDKEHFPLLTEGSESLVGLLMACDELSFCSPGSLTQSQAIVKQDGMQWHEYGCALWSTKSSWIEFVLPIPGLLKRCGILVVQSEIPKTALSPIDWVAENSPLHQLLPRERNPQVVEARRALLRQQGHTQNVEGPEDKTPRFVQSYCIFSGRSKDRDAELIATYLDVLNRDGVVIQLYRIADVNHHEVPLCRLALNGLFHLNAARIEGMEFVFAQQLKEFSPVYLQADQCKPKWAKFHPSRVLRTRPALRAMPSPAEIKDGIMHLSDYERVLEARRKEANLHMLAYERLVRPREMSLMNLDTNASMGAFSHRANGGAIYVLPERLVEEFNNTDCSEVQMGDITLPFPRPCLKTLNSHSEASR